MNEECARQAGRAAQRQAASGRKELPLAGGELRLWRVWLPRAGRRGHRLGEVGEAAVPAGQGTGVKRAPD